MLAIIDYQMGNLRSVQKGFERIGTAATIINEPEQIRKATKIVLPGVGAFGDAINETPPPQSGRTDPRGGRSRQTVPRHLPGLQLLF